MQTKLTKLEKYWILYDVGNSAFTLLISTIFPIYFNSLSAAAGVEEVDYLAYWGYATSLATLIVALLGPVLGTVADNRGYKKSCLPAAWAWVLQGWPCCGSHLPGWHFWPCSCWPGWVTR